MARRRPNAELRSREHFTADEVERLIAAAKDGRHRHRDATMLLVAYRHGLRVSELTDLRWDQVDFATANLHVRRAKKGTPATHPILGDELRALRRLRHACGFALANAGHDTRALQAYLGHKNIQHTVRLRGCFRVELHAFSDPLSGRHSHIAMMQPSPAMIIATAIIFRIAVAIIPSAFCH
jgi:type 1 fimbriae regulatory protein FimB/type 1 fimbriae regulatory protein FimE